MSVLIVAVLVNYVGMTYGPIAAFLAEFFPGPIRYTSVSVPYHIGNGWAASGADHHDLGLSVHEQCGMGAGVSHRAAVDHVHHCHRRHARRRTRNSIWEEGADRGDGARTRPDSFEVYCSLILRASLSEVREVHELVMFYMR